MKSRCELPPRPPSEALVLGSLPSSLSPTCRHQHHQQIQQATSLPSWGQWGGWRGAGGEPISWEAPWSWAWLLQGADGGCASQHQALWPLDCR